MTRIADDGSCIVRTDPAYPLDMTMDSTLIGAKTETAPSTDIASSGLNGRLQRVAQRMTSLISLFPTALGASTSANAFPVVLSTDGTVLGATNETAPATDTATAGVNGRLQRIAQRITSMMTQLPAALGSTTSTASMSVTLASDEALIGIKMETAPGNDTASSGLNGRLQRIAQRITSLISVFPTALGASTSANSFPVVLSTDGTVIGATNETAPGSDTGTSGINGRLQRVAQRITSLIALFPTALGSAASSASFPVVIASDQGAVKTKGNMDMFEFTPSLDTAAYASGDILFDTTAVTSVFDSNGGKGLLHSVVINDKDDQGIALELWFLRASTTLGTRNAAVTISDAGADDIIGMVSVPASAFTDLGGTRVAVISGIGQLLKTGGSTTSLWVAGVTRGAPTYTASGLVVKFGLIDKN